MRLLFFLLLLSRVSFGQIYLENASFEGEPQDATTPIGWMKCELGTTPDILPGPWGVYQAPVEGETYVGLITRKGGSWESIGQRLTDPLRKKDCYQMSMNLAYSNTYAGYNEPIKLRIWGGQNRCEKDQLLAETDLIDHTDWKEYIFEFKPETRLKYIIIEAYYDTSKKYTHNGNILIDSISPIYSCVRA